MKLSEAKELYLKDCANRQLSPQTIKKYGVGIDSFMKCTGDIEITSVTREDVRKWRDWLLNCQAFIDHSHPNEALRKGKKLSTHTIRSRIGSVRIFLNWLVYEDFIAKNPANKVKMPAKAKRQPKAINEADFQKMVAVAHSHHGAVNKDSADIFPKRNLALLYALRSSGARIGALLNIKVDSLTIYDDGAVARTITKGQGGGQEVDVLFSDQAAIALLEWLDVRPSEAVDHGDYLFCGIEGGRGKKMTSSAVLSMLNRLAARAGVDNPHFSHSFRHGFAIDSLENGADLSEISAMLHHSSVKTTADFYLHFGTSKLRKIHQRTAPA